MEDETQVKVTEVSQDPNLHADHKKRFPESVYLGTVVKWVKTVHWKILLLAIKNFFILILFQILYFICKIIPHFTIHIFKMFRIAIKLSGSS